MLPFAKRDERTMPNLWPSHFKKEKGKKDDPSHEVATNQYSDGFEP